MSPDENTGIVTILFTDIEGSTLLWERDADRMRLALAGHDKVSRGAVEAELDDWLGYAAPSFNLVDDDFNAGRTQTAIVEAGNLVEQCRQHRGLGLLGLMLFHFGDYLLAANRLDEGRSIGVEGIRLNRSLGRSAPVNACIETVALATALGGLHERAARLAGYVSAFYHNVNFVRGQTQQRTWERLMATLREPLASGDLEGLMAEGGAWSEERAVNEATKA